jgi:hypothetical protein
VSDRTHMDDIWEHLFPPFRQALQAVVAEVQQALGEEWVLVEGYRSVDRQLFLYGQGRPWFRPYGRGGQIVTWKRSPTRHGAGIAADLRPAKVDRVGYDGVATREWETYRRIYLEYGKKHDLPLDNPAWGNGDLQHVQFSGEVFRRQGQAWVDRGFPPSPDPPATQPVVKVVVNGHLVPDADGVMDGEHVRIWVRPVLAALGWTILYATATYATVVMDHEGPDAPPGEGKEANLPLRVIGDHGTALIADLENLGVKASWDGKNRTVSITE